MEHPRRRLAARTLASDQPPDQPPDGPADRAPKGQAQQGGDQQQARTPPREIQAEAWPTEDFELARSLVDSPLPEDDLFAGIRDRVEA